MVAFRRKILIVIALLVIAVLPAVASADESGDGDEMEFFEAEVVEIIEEKTVESDDGVSIKQQNLRVRASEGEREGEEVTIIGISELIVLKNETYDVGDHVIIGSVSGPDDESHNFVHDRKRTGALWCLAALFALFVVAVGRLKGLRALVVLFLTFVIILLYIVPQILNGANPLLTSLIGSIGILFLAIFMTEGFNAKSRIAFVSVLLSLGVTLFLSWLFTRSAHLTGFSSDEAFYLLGIGDQTINLQGILLAGIVIGAIGVIDDVVINQVSVVKELAESNTKFEPHEVFRRAMRVGRDHINAMVNTLFLAYAGVALPLLMLFSIDEPPFLTFAQIVNSELIATEIIRALIGSIGLILGVPIATWFAVRRYVRWTSTKDTPKPNRTPD